MLTDIGRYLRKLRIDNDETLKNMAEKLDVSSAFLSAVENGKKKMPEAWMAKICNLYNLTEEDAALFQAAIINTNQSIELNLENSSEQKRDLAITFARHFKSLDDESSQLLEDYIDKIMKGV